MGTGSYGYGIVADDNDDIWMTTYHRCDIVRFDPDTESFRDYKALPDEDEGCVMRRLDNDSMGNIWFGVYSHGKLGKIDPVSGEQTWFDLPVPFGSPYATQVDPEDSVWVGDDRTGLVRLNPETEEFTYFPGPRKSAHPKMEITREGAVWFGPRDPGNTRVTVLYPDVRKMTTLGAFY